MKHTPSPQSVVVPVELAETPAIRNALGLYRSAILCGEQWSDTCRDAYLAALKELDQLAMLAAAPAPSSLAGGEDMTARQIAMAEAKDAVAFFDQVKAASQDEKIAVGRDHWNRLEAAIRAVAALSPEAPAREGVMVAETTRRLVGLAQCRDAIARCIIGPRDPVPEGSKWSLDELREVRWSSASVAERQDALWAAASILALTPRHEAPAEGAGEDGPIDRMLADADARLKRKEPDINGARVCLHGARLALRAAPEAIKAAYQRGWNDREDDIIERAERIAPEAREGDHPVAWVKKGARHVIWWGAEYPVHGEPGEYDALYAAPSADKLLEADFWCELMGRALDALDTIAADGLWGEDASAELFAEQEAASIRQAYAPDALKAEGA